MCWVEFGGHYPIIGLSLMEPPEGVVESLISGISSLDWSKDSRMSSDEVIRIS